MRGIFDAHSFLGALGEQLAFSGGGPYDLAVCGGFALNVLGLVIRTTRDIDVFALVEHGHMVPCLVMPPDLAEAASRVAKDFSLPPDWINVQAARWACETQDQSEGFRLVLRECIGALGFTDVAEEL